jgi:hypothetical protein
MKSIVAWRNLERTLTARGLAWAFHRLPVNLQVARTPEFPLGIQLEHLLPQDYRAFVHEVGYPVVGFSYYCRIGLSILPPTHIETCSTMVADANGGLLKPARTSCPMAHAAFFAGTDLSEIEGWSFAPDGFGKDPVVWVTSRCMLVEAVGTFDCWATTQAARIDAWARALSAADRKTLEEKNEGEDDPHRALDYALDSSEPHNRSTKKDRSFHWVCDQSTTPYRWSVIDDDGVWQLKPGQPFDSVGPFVRGSARVETNGKLLRINPGGTVLKDLSPKPQKTKKPSASLSLTGKKVRLVGGFNVMNVSLHEFQQRAERLGATFIVDADPASPADIYIIGRESHFPEYLEAAKAQQKKAPSTQLIQLGVFAKQLGLTD